MGVLLYKLAGRPTGRQIGQGLGLSFGTCGYHSRRNPRFSVAMRWGGAEFPERDVPGTINRAEAIARSGKISTFRLLEAAEVPIPEWSTDPGVAASWEAIYLARTTSDSGGRGIEIVLPGGAASRRFPLYTRLVPDCREYRLHVVGDAVISVQRKYLERPEQDEHDGIIKSHSNGYVFKTPQRDLNTSRKEAAIAAVRALRLDFGAVDMVIDSDGKEYVLEINTAPACSPMRVEAYVRALRPMLAERA